MYQPDDNETYQQMIDRLNEAWFKSQEEWRDGMKKLTSRTEQTQRILQELIWNGKAHV